MLLLVARAASRPHRAQAWLLWRSQPPRRRFGGARRAHLPAFSGRRSGSSWKGADLWSDHDELEFAQEYFALAQEHVAGRLVEALHERGLVADKNPTARRAPEEPQEPDHDDLPRSKVDPFTLMLHWTEDGGVRRPLAAREVEAILLQVERMLEELHGPLIDLALPESTLSGSPDSDPKIVVVGDTHGQLSDVLHIFHEHGTPGPSCVYLFNGDITDRGPEAAEIWMLVLAFKLRFPESVHVLRGNHENEKLNSRPKKWGGGFSDECNAKYPQHIFGMFNRVFKLLPVFAVIHSDIFVVHAGLFRRPGVTLHQLRTMAYREQYPEPPMLNKQGEMTRGPWSDDETVLFDAQWADPQAKPGIGASKRGKCVVGFGPDITEQFLQRNGLSLIIRSHEVPKSRRGFDLAHNDRLLTVFSASNYGGLLGNSGAVAVIRHGPPPADATAGPVAVQTRRGLSVQCVEHYPDQLEQETSAGIRMARSAAKVLKHVPGSDREAANEAQRHALGLLFLEGDELELRFNALDTQGRGFLSFATVVEELKDVCGEFDWGGLLSKTANFGDKVSYVNLIASVKVTWRTLGPAQTAALAEAMLQAELHLDALVDLFDFTGDGLVAPSELHRSLKLLLPNLSEEQLRSVRKLFGDDPLTMSELVQRFVRFMPPLALPEPWMGDMLLQLWQIIQRWAGPSVEPHAALLQFYTVFDEDKDGMLSPEEIVEVFIDLERRRIQAGDLRSSPLNASEVTVLARALDTNNSKTISFLEFARAFQTSLNKDAEHASEDHLLPAKSTWTASIFVHRNALMHCCRLMDADGDGYVSAKDFVSAVETLGVTLGRPFSAAELQALETSIGTPLFDYHTALNDFSVSFDATRATRMTHSIMMPF